MKDKLESSISALVNHDEQLMDQHGEGILDGYTREPLDKYAFRLPTRLYLGGMVMHLFGGGISTGEMGSF